MALVGLYDLESTVTRVREAVVGAARRFTTPPPAPVAPVDSDEDPSNYLRFLQKLGIGLNPDALGGIPFGSQIYWQPPLSAPTGLSQLWATRPQGMPYRPWWASVVETYQASRGPEASALMPTPAIPVVGPYKNSAVVYLPGFLNFGPTDEWMAALSRQFGNGGVILGAGQHGSIRRGEGFSVYGSEEPVLQPDWRLEVPMMVYRLSKALEGSPALAQADHLVIVGYSKGSLLAHGLKALTLLYDYQTNNGKFVEQAYLEFPGLKNLPPERVKRVMEVLGNSEFHMLAPPIEGVPAESPVVRAVSALFLKQSAAYYSEEFLDGYFERLGFGPEIVDSIIQVRSPRTLGQSLARDRLGEGTWGRAVLAGSVRVGFRFGVGPLMGASKGDEIVRPVSVRHPNLLELEVRDNHLGIVAGNDVALELGQVLMLNHPAMRVFAQPLQLDLRLIRRQDVARTIFSRMQVLDRRNPYPSLLAELEVASGIFNISGVSPEAKNALLMRLVYDLVYTSRESDFRPLVEVVREAVRQDAFLSAVFMGGRQLMEAESRLRETRERDFRNQIRRPEALEAARPMAR